MTAHTGGGGREEEEGEEEGNIYSLTFALDGGGWLNATPWLLYPQERERLPIVQEAACAPGQVWTDAEILTPNGTRSPDRPARSKWLYRPRSSSPL
jgi:hypothetical protein